MNTSKLMDKEVKLNLYDLKGLAYIKDSKGRSDNLRFWIICNIINVETNNCIITYKVECFDKNSPEHEIFTTTNYSEAVDKYNELIIKYDGHKARSLSF